jgi:hypothetical protein
MGVYLSFYVLMEWYLGLMLIHLTVVEVSTVAFLTVQSAALLHVDGDDSHGYEDDHDDEANKLAEEDGRKQKAEEADADGGSGIGQEPAPYAHELQRFLESLENRDAVEIDVH